MQFESYRRSQPTINLSALIDVVFILVIFIVLAASFDKVRALEVTLPSARAASAPQAEALQVVVASDGSVKVAGVATDRDRLRGHLAELRGVHDTMVILSDGAVPFERAVWVLGEAGAAGFTDVSIATRQEAR
jgi:biopolymer transport protein ExbD